MADRPEIFPGVTCSKCIHKKMDVVETPYGPQQQWFCGHERCEDPVTGDPVPCNVARQQLLYCGYDGRYFQPKEEPTEAKIIELVKPSK